MQTLLPEILDTLAACLNSQDEESAGKSLENLISLTGTVTFLLFQLLQSKILASLSPP
jgi:hypothetical protein